MKKTAILAIVCVLALSVGAFCAPKSGSGKKIIEYGWDVPTPDYLLENIATMERHPFDGLMFRIVDGGIGMTFDTRKWPEENIKKHISVLKKIKWNKYKHNFLMLYSASDYGMDWFNDDHWDVILDNARASARLAKAGKCVGIVFDPEPYGKDPWLYPGDYPDKTREELAEKVRQRGKQWIQALQEKWPKMHLLLFYFEPSMTDPWVMNLLGPFCNGLVEGASNKCKIINGNEHSYYYTKSESYIKDRDTMKNVGPTKIDPKLKSKYNKIVQAGMALYMDQSLALRTPREQYISSFMTPQDRLKYFEFTVYWALQTTDEYVWCYSERMNWWNGTFPEGADKAIVRARDKYEKGLPLGYTLDGIVSLANRKMNQDLGDKIVRRFGIVDKVAQDKASPTIDGKLDDDIWKAIQPLEGLLPSIKDIDKEVAPTTVRVTYDEKNLYLAVKCSEPVIDKLSSSGVEKDSNVWLGDCIELFISTTTDTPYDYRHFIVGPNNVQWDGAAPPEENDVTWNADWQSATDIGDDYWAVEMAIPWSAIGGYPAENSTRFVNICRQRIPVGEWTSWSTVVTGFLDASKFGAWMFR